MKVQVKPLKYLNAKLASIFLLPSIMLQNLFIYSHRKQFNTDGAYNTHITSNKHKERVAAAQKFGKLVLLQFYFIYCCYYYCLIACIHFLLDENGEPIEEEQKKVIVKERSNDVEEDTRVSGRLNKIWLLSKYSDYGRNH